MERRKEKPPTTSAISIEDPKGIEMAVLKTVLTLM
jgi:hypothetical protein